MTLGFLVFFTFISLCVCPFSLYIYRRDKKRGYIIERKFSGEEIISREDNPSKFQSIINDTLFRFIILLIISMIVNLVLGVVLYKEIKLEQEWIDSIR